MPNRRKPTKWDDESFAKKVSEVSPTIQIVGKYSKFSDAIECFCKECKSTWFPTAGNLLKGCGCPECAKNKQKERMKGRVTTRNKWTQESVEKRVEEIDSDIEVLGKFVNTASHIDCRCKKCGSLWSPTANNLLQGRSHCSDCARNKINDQVKLTHDEFVERVHAKNPNIEVIGQFKTTKDRVRCRCKLCGNEWAPIGDSLLSGKGCKHCSYILNKTKRMLSKDDFMSRMRETNPNIQVLGEYKGAYSTIQCRCLICDNLWNTKPHYLLTGRGCPECAHSSTSYIEQFLLQAFRYALGKNEVLSRDKTVIGKELDIYVPKYKLALEPGSWELHKNKKENDDLKIDLCKRKGINLIVIYYDYEEEMKSDENHIYYAKDLAKKSEQKELIGLIRYLFDLIGVKDNLEKSIWNYISNLAYIKSRRVTTEQFRERLYDINPNITLLGEYKSSKEKTKCKCNICGNEWKVAPGDLLQGRGCPACSKKRLGLTNKLSQDDYLNLLREKNPNIEPLETYTGSNNRIRCRCKMCSYEWSPVATSLVSSRRRGCPNCGGTRKKSTSEFKNLMKEINPNIEILGNYVNGRTGIKCRCKLCGREWEPKPQSLIAGHGCRCRNMKKLKQ